jgi:hypothetical protein
MPRPVFRKPNGEPDLALIRVEYQRAVKNGALVDSMIDALKGLKSADPLVLAIIGALETLKARDLWFPLEKLYWSKKSQDTLARAIAIDPAHIETRFLRYSIQLSLPGYLNLSQHLDQDKTVIIQQINTEKSQSLGNETVRIIADFMLKTGRCGQVEQLALQKALNPSIGQ